MNLSNTTEYFALFNPVLLRFHWILLSLNIYSRSVPMHDPSLFWLITTNRIMEVAVGENRSDTSSAWTVLALEASGKTRKKREEKRREEVSHCYEIPHVSISDRLLGKSGLSAHSPRPTPRPNTATPFALFLFPYYQNSEEVLIRHHLFFFFLFFLLQGTKGVSSVNIKP